MFGLFTIEVEARVVNRAILNALDAVSHATMAAFLETAADAWIKRRITLRFKNEGDSASGKWAPLRPLTNSFRESAGFPPHSPINVRTGEMLDWLLNLDPDVTLLYYGGAQAIWAEKLPSDKWLRKKFVTAQRGMFRTTARPVLVVDMTDAVELSFQLDLFVKARLALP